MIFDLEFNIVGELTQEGLSSVSEALYSTNKLNGDKITPASWDIKSLFRKPYGNSNTISTSSFQNMESIPTWLYASGVKSAGDIKLKQIITRNNMVCPIFDQGKIYTYKFSFDWSCNTIVKIFEITDNYYVCELDVNVDIDSINIYTLALEYPGYLTNKKEFKYVEYDNISLKSTFKLSSENYKFTLIRDSITNKQKAYLNIDPIQYSDVQLGTAFASKNSIFALPEFPVTEMTITGVPEENYRIFSSIVLAKNDTVDDELIKASFKVTPMVVYKQSDRSFRNDPVFKDINITPSAIDFTEGVICLFNSFGMAGGTIMTKNGPMPLPTNLEIYTDKTSLSQLDQVKIVSRLTGIDGIPIKNADIKFQITAKQENICWIENASKEYINKTGIDGKTDANIIINQARFGWYLQKEWAENIDGKGYLNIPFDVFTSNANDIYLYFVTSDDPILGRLGATEEEVPITENYLNESQLDSYYINGRKIAYVKLQNDLSLVGSGARKLKSFFVKPKNIINNTQVRTYCRDLYIKNLPDTIMQELESSTITILGDEPIAIKSAEGYASGSVPNDQIAIWEIESTEGTIIEFESELPVHENILGFWLITGTTGDISIKSIFEDTENLLYLESAPLDLPIMSILKSESEFILSDTELSNQNTQLGAFSYFTVHEYMKNPLGINACSYGCIFSDAVNGICKHQEKLYNIKYYEQDRTTGLCIHTPDYDSDLANIACPGLKAMFINPFIMKVEV